jgi:cytochrome c
MNPRRAALVMAFALSVCALFTACGRPEPATAPLSDADAERGRRLMAHYQCGSCHVIPQVPAAAGRIGPSLEHFGARTYIAGNLPNAPLTLARWIEAPVSLVPRTTMPDMGASTVDARDMAAYLMTLR